METKTKLKSKKKIQPAVKYRIKNSLLPTGIVYKIIDETLRMFERGDSLLDSPLIQWGRERLKRREWFYGVEKDKVQDKEEGLKARQIKVLRLYNSIKSEGYNGSLIWVFFDDEGKIQTYDGFHRLSILKYLGMEVDVNLVITTRDKNPQRRGDFPLVDKLIEINSGKNLYQPINDSRLKDFKLWRKDCQPRLDFILNNVRCNTIPVTYLSVLDIGCDTGYFCRELAGRDFIVTGLDSDKRRIAVSRYLSIINNIDIDYVVGRWQDYIKTAEKFDVILMLSIFHHSILKKGVDEAFKDLSMVRGKCDQLFFEAPASALEIKWLRGDDKRKYDLSETEFKCRVEDATGLKIKDSWRGVRWMYFLEAV